MIYPGESDYAVTREGDNHSGNKLSRWLTLPPEAS
ncbi:hypothetical protein MSL71_14710 [Desulfoluna butyratoxydans]|uniref:Uncharacterized protein n=1 Tax=Desulfoluna butyratoxydans TaxID=231438 RepID=A0A4U8YK29_9BACT|nr:hypothetical protein MSL71_14710 [Desulfoluna butyratoxydans]